MGRLTLNILLTFAQFEREVIGERIRDKFAASRARGMWMGGNVPLGYDVGTASWSSTRPRRPGPARFRAASPRPVGDRDWRKHCGRRRHQQAGRPLDKGDIYKLLNNRTYVGEAAHKGQVYPGEHQAIIARELWDQVHAVLQEARAPGPTRTGPDAGAAAGADLRADGRAMSPTHTRKTREAISLLREPGGAEGRRRR